ncbi:MAG: SAM-dependent chlorinase/fluorinase [Acidobacteria bacterium]|nr:SAM-dependent chlorinase/fluorinase [Acidobacteriota bacterium]
MPVITLTTDFGLSDHFVGTMKGVIAGIAPKANVVDICHLVKPHNIAEGAFVLSQAYRYFPKGTVHVAVVDPGVGTQRRPILAQAESQYFIGPDNGIFSFLDRPKVRVLENPAYFLREQSTTFHGRDIFAPCAAHLAAGVKPKSFGPAITDPVVIDLEPKQDGPKRWTGLVLKADHFGNLITNLPSRLGRPKSLKIGSHTITRTATTYENGEEPFLIAGSSGYFEISLNQASAEAALGCGAGTPLKLTLW